MQLCDKDILKAIKTGELRIDGSGNYPFDMYKQVQPASVDLRLGTRFLKFSENVTGIDINDIDKSEFTNLIKECNYNEGEGITIGPRELIYGQIHEQLSVGDELSARIVGRSRVARLGLSIHCTGSYINPGFCGAMPLQIYNFNNFPITIYPYTIICQLILYKVSGKPLIPYSERSAVSSASSYYNEINAGPSYLSVKETGGNSSVEKKIKEKMEDYYNKL